MTEVNPDEFLSVADLKAWIQRHQNVSVDSQLLLTSRAVQLKLESMSYGALTRQIDRILFEIGVIKQSLDISLVHLRHHAVGIEKSFNSTLDFATALEKDASAGSNWKSVLGKLDQIQVLPVLLSDKANDKRVLSDWIDHAELATIDHQFHSNQQACTSVLNQLRTDVRKVINEGHKLNDDANTWLKEKPSINGDSAWKDLLEDITTIVHKIQEDCDFVATLSDNVANKKTAVRLMTLHEKEFLPNISDMTREIWEISGKWVLVKVSAQKQMISFLQRVSKLQSDTSPLRPQITETGKRLKDLEAQRVVLARAIDMPYLYGAILLEFLRRQEWLTEVKQTVAKSAEAMAGWIDQEQHVRNKWQKKYGDSLGQLKTFGGSDSPSVDVSLLYSRESSMYKVTRKDMENYINILKNLNLDEECEELRVQYYQLSKPVIYSSFAVQKKPNKLFKGGSISESQVEPSFRSSTPIEDVDNAIIQGYEARIRKLEDLLHRNQFRESFQSPELKGVFKKPVTPPAANPEEIKRLQERIHKLEKENETSAQEVEKIKKNLRDSEEENKRLIEEARMMKSDLFDNLRTKENEFKQERMSLNGEIKELKGKIYDLEIDLDRETNKCLSLEGNADNLQQKVTLLETQLQTNQNSINEQLALEKAQIEANYDRLRIKFELLYSSARDISQKLFTSYKRSCDMLECIGLQATKVLDNNGELVSFKIQRVKGLGRRRNASGSIGDVSILDSPGAEEKLNNNSNIPIDPKVFYWLNSYYNDSEDEEPEADEDDRTSVITADSSMQSALIQKHRRKLSTVREHRYRQFLDTVYLDYDLFRDSVTKRFNDVEHLARKLQKEARNYRDRAHTQEQQSRQKLAYKSFQKGELALFLPTRDPTRDPNPWAAFNVGAPHYFLKPSSELQLGNREWVVARITKMEERVVDRAKGKEGDNPFDLSDGLRWHLIEAKEER
ncbi:hypothetical protein D0Z00_001827 [Geotrichum galactomycetum]|uniref:Uncharacterized protein n=1 Tax=Geotrichum galactomycetum TaxID=27317 RepID=A0ACB6V5T6_9ASCO|nr:hypothetical protein D0Z00_001827 [Geotrichum candidum]